MAAYGTDDGFLAYHIARGRDVATIDEDAIAPARLVASEWLDGAFRAQFPGLKVGLRAQVREWPRQGANDIYGYAIASDVPPVEIDNATYEATYREIKTPGSLVKDWTPSKYKRASVDGAVSVDFAMFNSASDIQTQFLAIGQILAPILTAVGGDFSALSGATSRV